MSSRAVLLSLLVAAIAASGVVIAQCRKSSRAIATLAEVRKGAAERTRDGSSWTPAEVGARFRKGSAVRTSADGEAVLAFGGGRALVLGPDTTVDFADVLTIVGEVTNESDKELVLMLAEGISRIGPRSTVRFTIGDRGERQILLVVGEATFEDREGKVENLQQNTLLVISETTTISEIDAGAVIDAAPPVDAFVPKTGAVTAIVKGRLKVTPPGGAEQTLRSGEHSLAAGTAIDLQRGSTVELRRTGSVAVLDGGGEGVVGTEDGALIDAASGNIQVSSPDSATLIKVPGGTVLTRVGRGRSDVRINRAKTKITARAGVLDVTGGGARESIKIGEWIMLSRRGAMEVYGRQPKFADFGIAAGESASIHDPGAPTAVRVRFGESCGAEGGVVEYGVGRARRIASGEGSSILLLKPGYHRYDLKCLEDGVPGRSAAHGTLRVDRSSGTKPLPLKPSNNFVDADGMSFRIKYQNLVPNITFKWPNAAAGKYKLMVKAQGQAAKSYATDGPSHTLKSGVLREGTYRFWFEGNGARSKEGVIIIVFDNAATSGYLRAPRPGASWGGMIDIAGAGIKGSRVSVGGSPLPLDGQHRFNAKVNKPGSQAALAVKFSHPLRGVHYYIRRNGRR